jgi:hypothetical protein
VEFWTVMVAPAIGVSSVVFRAPFTQKGVVTEGVTWVRSETFVLGTW